MLGNLSIWHMMLFLVIVVLVFGTGKLRNAGKDLGGFVKGFKEGMRDEEKPQTPPQQISQQDTSKSADTADKKDHV